MNICSDGLSRYTEIVLCANISLHDNVGNGEVFCSTININKIYQKGEVNLIFLIFLSSS